MSEETGFWTEQEIRDRLSTSTMVFSGFMPVGHLALSELVKHGISKVEVSMSKQDRTSWRRKKFIDYWCVGYVEHWRHYRLVSIGVAGCALQWEASSRKRPRLIRNRNEGRVIFLG